MSDNCLKKKPLGPYIRSVIDCGIFPYFLTVQLHGCGPLIDWPSSDEVLIMSFGNFVCFSYRKAGKINRQMESNEDDTSCKHNNQTHSEKRSE